MAAWLKHRAGKNIGVIDTAVVYLPEKVRFECRHSPLVFRTAADLPSWVVVDDRTRLTSLDGLGPPATGWPAGDVDFISGGRRSLGVLEVPAGRGPARPVPAEHGVVLDVSDALGPGRERGQQPAQNWRCSKMSQLRRIAVLEAYSSPDHSSGSDGL